MKFPIRIAMAVAAAALVGAITLPSASPTSATGGPDHDKVCAQLDTGHIDGGGLTFTYDADHQLVDEACVKAGSKQQGFGPEYVQFDPPQQKVTVEHSSGKTISHVSFSVVDPPPPTTDPPPTTTPPTDPPPTTEPEPDPVNHCDPADKPGGVSILDWLTAEDPVPDCVGITVAVECGQFNASIVGNDTPYNYGVSYSVGELAFNADNTGDAEVRFVEDEGDGTAEVFYWAVGPESDYFRALGLPWFELHAESVMVPTDCEDDPPPTTTPDTTPDTTVPPETTVPPTTAPPETTVPDTTPETTTPPDTTIPDTTPDTTDPDPTTPPSTDPDDEDDDDEVPPPESDEKPPPANEGNGDPAPASDTKSLPKTGLDDPMTLASWAASMLIAGGFIMLLTRFRAAPRVRR